MFVITEQEYKYFKDLESLTIKLSLENQKLKKEEVKESIIFYEYIKIWLIKQNRRVEAGNLQKNTFNSYNFCCKHMINYFFNKDNCMLDNITASDIEEYFEYLMIEYGLKSNTVRRHYSCFHSIFEYAIKNKLVLSNPAKLVDLPAKKSYEANYVNVDDLNELVKIFKTTVYYIPVLLCATLGLRRSEALGVKWSSIDFEKSILSVNHKVVLEYDEEDKINICFLDKMKNNSSKRNIKIPLKVLDILKLFRRTQIYFYKQNRDTYNKDYLEYVCVKPNGNLITPSNLSNSFRTTLYKTQYKHIRLHDLRHSCASILHNLGYSLKDIADFLGHCNINMTSNVYTHIFEERTDKMSSDFNNILTL